MQLTPFKAYFEYYFSGNTKHLQDPEELEIYLGRISNDGANVDTEKYVKTYLTGFNIPIFQKDFKIPFDAHSVHNINPETLKINSNYQSINFKVKSFPVEVIQINKDEITFVTEKGVVHTVEVSSEIELIRL